MLSRAASLFDVWVKLNELLDSRFAPNISFLDTQNIGKASWLLTHFGKIFLKMWVKHHGISDKILKERSTISWLWLIFVVEENIGKASWLLAHFNKILEENVDKASWLCVHFSKFFEANVGEALWLLAQSLTTLYLQVVFGCNTVQS